MTQQRKTIEERMREGPLWDAIAEKMRMGESSRSIARFIQAEEELLDIGFESLARTVSTVKNKDYPELSIDRRTEGKSLAIDGADEMAKLIIIQKNRLERAIGIEEMTPVLTKQVGAEVDRLADLLEKHLKISQDSGAARKVPDTHLHIVEGGPYQNALSQMEDDRRLSTRESIAQNFADNNRRVMEGEFRVLPDDEDEDAA